MKKYYPEWTQKQFRELLASEHLSDEELGERIGRTPGAVAVVRAGVKNWRLNKGKLQYSPMSRPRNDENKVERKATTT